MSVIMGWPGRLLVRGLPTATTRGARQAGATAQEVSASKATCC